MQARSPRVVPGLVAVMLLAAPSLAHAGGHGHGRHRAAAQPQAEEVSADDLNGRQLAALGTNGAPQAAATPAEAQADAPIQSGIASWYGAEHAGRRTSLGTRFDPSKLTAAHAWLPLGSQVRVILAGTDRSVDVTITDRIGTHRRVIDLSRRAAADLGMVARGTARVSIFRL